jgi:hypothetical protein
VLAMTGAGGAYTQEPLGALGSAVLCSFGGSLGPTAGGAFCAGRASARVV